MTVLTVYVGNSVSNYVKEKPEPVLLILCQSVLGWVCSDAVRFIFAESIIKPYHTKSKNPHATLSFVYM